MQTLIVRTPLLRFQQTRIFLKPESLQPFASYKLRGVAQAVMSAPEELRANGLCTASAGNMAQAVAFMARELKLPCRIIVPDSAPEVKKAAIRNLGAELDEKPFHEVWELVRNPPRSTNELFIHPVFTPGLLEGYGRMAQELLEDRPSLHAVVVPFGVGGLTLGLGRALKKLKPEIRIYTCEPETASPLAVSLKRGRASQVERQPSFIDAIGTPEVLPEVFAEAKDLVHESRIVRLDETRAALRELAERAKLVCEGAAAASFVAARQLASENPTFEIAAILSGGNLPFQFLSTV